MLLVASGLFAMFYFNSLYVQRVLGYSPIEAGLAFIPFTARDRDRRRRSRRRWSERSGSRTVAIIGMSSAPSGCCPAPLDVGGTTRPTSCPG